MKHLVKDTGQHLTELNEFFERTQSDNNSKKHLKCKIPAQKKTPSTFGKGIFYERYTLPRSKWEPKVVISEPRPVVYSQHAFEKQLSPLDDKNCYGMDIEILKKEQIGTKNPPYYAVPLKVLYESKSIGRSMAFEPKLERKLSTFKLKFNSSGAFFQFTLSNFDFLKEKDRGVSSFISPAS